MLRRTLFQAEVTVKFSNAKSGGYTYKTVKRPVVAECPMTAHAKVKASSVATLALNTHVPREFRSIVSATIATIVIRP